MGKNPILILLFFLYAGNIEVIAQAPKVSGKIRNLTGKEIVFSYPLDELISVSDTIKVSNSDTFSFSFTPGGK